MKVIKELLPFSLFAAVIFAAVTYPAYACTNPSTHIVPDHRAIPITVWVICEGRPVGLVTTSSHGFAFGDAIDLVRFNKEDPRFIETSLGESFKLNNYFKLDLTKSKVVECRV